MSFYGKDFVSGVASWSAELHMERILGLNFWHVHEERLCRLASRDPSALPF